MFSYKNELTLNNKFNKSTNIIYDDENCKDYIVTQSTKDTLKTFLRHDYHNSIALIGPFGSGKSSLLLYINTLLANNNNSKECLESLKVIDNDLLKQHDDYIKDRSFLKIKMIGEHTSFKAQFKNVICEEKYLKRAKKYLNENLEFQLSKALEYINKDLMDSPYSDILFSIDEFGKFIEHSLAYANENDIFDLQTLAEYVNKNDCYKLIISLHKSFSEYSNSLNISFSDWDKIQGRFENIVFKDDYYEMLNIFKETISLKDTKNISASQKIVQKVCDDTIFENIDINLFKRIVPIHPFSAIVISEIFTRYFQNQRSIFSFLFSTEPFAFQEFIEKEQKKSTLYLLSDLYDYISYLLKVYTIILPDKEIWYLAEHKLKDFKSASEVKRAIIKVIALVHTFKLSKDIKTDSKHILLALIDTYAKADINNAINELIDNNTLIFQEQTQSLSLIEDSNININKELNDRLSKNKKIDFELKLNELIINRFLVAKRYFTKYGSRKLFEKIILLDNEKIFNRQYKIFFSNKEKKYLLKQSLKFRTSIFIPLDNIDNSKQLIRKIDALEDINEEFAAIMSRNTRDIINDMIDDYKMAFEKSFSESYINGFILHNGIEYKYNSKYLQTILSDITEKTFDKAPAINNYTLNHSIANKGGSTTPVKKLFEAMLNKSHLENLGIEKYPAEKALYLSIIKPSGFHTNINGSWELKKPTNLNFQYVWSFIEKELKDKIHLELLIDKLSFEPYGLNQTTALFVISLFILVNKEEMHIIRDNTYTFTLTTDLLINMWKAPNKYQFKKITLTENESKLFKAYVEITTDLTEYSYSKDKVLSIIKTLYSKFSALPEYVKTTKKISKEAIALRSAIVSMKDPIEAFFVMFPKSLGYGDIENISNKEFIEKFKSAFNEIALSYKKELISIEKFFANTFHLENKSFPFGNALLPISEKLLRIDTLDTQTKAILRSFTYSNSFIEFIDNISVILIGIKIETCDDNDIIKLKDKLEILINKILSRLELTDISTNSIDVRKISLDFLDSNVNRIISINKNNLDRINKKVGELKDMIPKEYTNDEKLFLISQLLNEELNHA